MTNKNTICVRCGKAQSNPNVFININKKYITLQKPILCPRCKIQTTHIATGEIETLRKKIEIDPSGPLDSYVLKLIKR